MKFTNKPWGSEGNSDEPQNQVNESTGLANQLQTMDMTHAAAFSFGFELSAQMSIQSANSNNNSNQNTGDDDTQEETQEESQDNVPEIDTAVEAIAAPAEEIEDNQSMYSESVATAMTLSDDEGSTITEGSEWGDDFAPWELQLKSNEFTVRDLVTMRKEYQFRVVAVNEAGRSQASKPS